MKLSLHNVRRERDDLLVSYEVRNEHESAIFIADAISDNFDILGEGLEAPTDQLAQLCHGGEERLFVLVGNTPDPRPRDRRYYEVYVPNLTRLELRETKETTIRCPLPLVEWSLYRPPKPDEAGIVLREISTLHLAVDYLEEGSWRHAPVEERRFPGVYRGSGIFRRAHAECNVSDLNLVLMVREKFPRFAEYWTEEP